MGAKVRYSESYPRGLYISLTIRSESYQHYDASTIYQQFTYSKMLWDTSKDCADLVNDIEGLLNAGKLANIKKIICFGLGQFFIDEHQESFSPRRWCFINRRMGQHAAALTIAEVLNRRQGGERVTLLAQDPSYYDEDKHVLRQYGFKIADWDHGVQEGFVEVDDSTFVISINFGDRVQQVVCETSRPAAMIWAPPERACQCCSNDELHMSPTCDVLATGYWETQPSYLRHA